MRLNDHMRPKYTKGAQYKHQKSGGGTSGIKGSKNLLHPIGFSGRTIGGLIQKFRPPNSSRSK